MNLLLLTGSPCPSLHFDAISTFLVTGPNSALPLQGTGSAHKERWSYTVERKSQPVKVSSKIKFSRKISYENFLPASCASMEQKGMYKVFSAQEARHDSVNKRVFYMFDC